MQGIDDNNNNYNSYYMNMNMNMNMNVLTNRLFVQKQVCLLFVRDVCM